MRVYKTKRHECLSEYLTEVRADRLDEWQMDEIIEYVKELEKFYNKNSNNGFKEIT